MSLNKTPENIKKKAIIITSSRHLPDVMKEWWEETQKRLKEDPHYLPIKSIPKEELVK